MSETTIKIRTALNGWFLEIKLDQEQTDRYAFSYDDCPEGEQEVKAFSALLSTLNNLIGPSTSRYSKYRVYVEVRPGDKYSDSLDSED